MPGLFHGILVGGTKLDGPFVVALRENGPDDFEATFVSLGDEPRTCSLGPAIGYTTVGQHPMFTSDDEPVDDRPGRILTVDGHHGETSGTLRAFDTSCNEVLQAPGVEWPVRSTFGLNGVTRAYLAHTVEGSLLWIDPWVSAVRTLGEHVSSYGYLNPETLWLVEDGTLVLRDIDGNALVSVGSNVTEVAAASSREEVAFVDKGGLYTMKLAELKPASVATKGTPCKPKYTWLTHVNLAYLDDCAAGNLALLDMTTGETQVFSSAVTDMNSLYTDQGQWTLFLREPPGGERELWAIPEGGAPTLVGLNPDPALYKIRDAAGHGIFVLLGYDGETSTLATWTPNGGTKPLLERVGWVNVRDGYMTAVADREGEVGALVALHMETLDPALRAEGVPWRTVRFSVQAPVFGYIRGWDSVRGAGAFEVWIPFNGQQTIVDEGVGEFSELIWPEPGAVYTVRTPGREGLWTAHVHL